MTVPGVRAIGCGTASDYLDLFENWGAVVSDKPNLLANLKQAGVSTGIIGDSRVGEDVPALAGHDPDRNGSVGVRVLHPVDGETRPHPCGARPGRSSERNRAPGFWSCISSGSTTPATRGGRRATGTPPRRGPWTPRSTGCSGLVDADTTVVITSDHAITNRGGHGGSDAEARRTPLVMLGRGIRQVSGLAVDQVDLTPTLAR
jgi:hypothetical protein